MTLEAGELAEQVALQLDWLKLPQAAALLRRQAVEIEHLKQDLQTEVACVAVKDAEIERLTTCLKKANDQAEHFEREWYLRGDEIERLKSEAELFAKHTGLTLAAKDTLLRQALGAMFGIRDFTDKQLVAKAIAAIKQHLGEV